MKKPEIVRGGRAREILHYLLIIGALFAFRSSFADHYVVPTGSMEYTLLPGDRVLVDKTAYGVQLPFTDLRVTAGDPVTRGEVVIFDSPRDGKRLIKRVVAVGGDRVSVMRGHVSINDVPLTTSYGIERFGSREAVLNLSHGGGPDALIDTVPEGMLLTVGDHRGNSLDGRFFGLVRERDVYARAVGVYFRRGDWFVWQKL